MNSKMNIDLLQADLKVFFQQHGLKSTVSIASRTGISQSTVYRALEKKNVRLTSGLKKLVSYSGLSLVKYKEIEPASCKTLMDTLQQVWDGSEAHAKLLSKLLLAAHSCNMSSTNAIRRHGVRD